MQPMPLFKLYSLPLSLCLLSLFARCVLAATQPTCYSDYLNSVGSVANDRPCAAANGTSGPVSCCSSGDTCMGSNICYGPGGSHQDGPGFYLSGCTDVTFQDASCPHYCGSNGYPDIVYSETLGLWACCTVVDSKVNCSLPTQETFAAPVPDQLKILFTAYSSTASPTPKSATTTTSTVPTTSASQLTTTTTSSASTTSTTQLTSSASSTTTPVSAAVSQTPTSNSTVTSPSPDPLPIGAKAGIAVGVGVAFVVFFALLSLTTGCIRARRKTRALENGLALQNALSGFKDFGYGYRYGDGSGSTIYTRVHAQDGQDSMVYELNPKPAPLPPVELGGWDNYAGGNYRIPAPPKKHDTYYHP